MTNDPLHSIETKFKEIHDQSGKYTKPVLKKYPLLFTFLVAFSLAAIIHGFEILTDEIEIFHTHPTLLMIIGIIALTFTGTLYQVLQKGE